MGRLPARGAWIEIPLNGTRILKTLSRSPHGEHGLKFVVLRHITCPPSVAPRTGSMD